MSLSGGTDADSGSSIGENKSGKESMIDTSRANETRRDKADFLPRGNTGTHSGGTGSDVVPDDGMVRCKCRVCCVGGPIILPRNLSRQRTTPPDTAKVDRAPSDYSSCGNPCADTELATLWANAQPAVGVCFFGVGVCTPGGGLPCHSGVYALVANKTDGQRRRNEVTSPGISRRARNSGVTHRSSRTIS